MEIEPEQEVKSISYNDLNDYQKKAAMHMGYMGIVASKGTPEEALKNSMEILKRENVPESIAVTALYSFVNTLLVHIASEFEEPKDERNKES